MRHLASLEMNYVNLNGDNMEFNTYQAAATMTVKDSIKNDLDYFALGLGGETGEVQEMIKRIKRDGSFDKDLFVKELGDVAWYLSQLARCVGVDFNTVATTNLDKLASRQQRGVIGGSGNNR